MKSTIIKFIFFSGIILFFKTELFSQEDNEKPLSNIRLIGRYINNQIELRLFPDRKQVLNYGLVNGFIIERADLTVIPEGIDDVNDLHFVNVGRTSALKENQWQQLIMNSDTEIKKNLIMAKDYFTSLNNNKVGSFNFNDGIKDLLDQKSKEDMEYLVVLMNASKTKEVAIALGLAFIDEKVEANKRYIYRVKIENFSPNYIIIGVPHTIETKDEEPFKHRKISVKEGDSNLSFLWEENDVISGTIVERKNPTTNKWELITKAPKFNLNQEKLDGFFDDSLVNYQLYEYKFYGLNPFGEKVLFGTAKGMPRDLTPPKKPIIVSAVHYKPEEILIKWEISKPEDSDLKGFLIGRSEANKGEFEKIHDSILSKDIRSIIDTKFNRTGTNYYVIQAIDTSGNISSTVPEYVTLIDSVPPQKPKFISGKIDSLGIVTLVIDKNGENDLMGYRLYKANSDEHEFSVIKEGFNPNDSTIQEIQSIFIDTVTLNSLTPYIYYRAIALDYNFNQSQFSDILKIKRPDKIKPVSPFISEIRNNNNKIILQLTMSTSEDVIYNSILKRVKGEKEWETLVRISDQIVEYIDTIIKPGIKYEYTMTATDDSGLISEYGNIVGIGGISYPVKVIEKFEGKYVNNHNILSWYIDKSKPIPSAYFVYRSENGDGYRLVKKIESPSKLEYIDNNINDKESYKYIIQPRAKNIEYLDSEELLIAPFFKK